MTLDAYRDCIARYLLRQSPPVILAGDNLIWDVVNIAYRQQRSMLWMAALALMIHRTLGNDKTPRAGDTGRGALLSEGTIA